MTALLLTLLAAPPGLVVESRGAPACLDTATLDRALRPHLEGPAKVTLSGAVTVTLERPGFETMSRTLAFTGADCADLQQTLALLVLSWWPTMQPVKPRAALPVETRRAPAPSAPRAPPARDLVSALFGPPAEPPPPPPPAAPPPEPIPPPLEAAPAPQITAAPEPPAEPQPLLRGFTVGLTLAAHASYDGVLSSSGRIALDAGRDRGLGGVLDVGLESSRFAEKGPGRVDARMGYASLLARWRVGEDRVKLAVALGLRVFRIEASSTGYVDDKRAELYSPAVAAAAQLEWTLVGQLFLAASIEGFARMQSEALTIRDLGPVVTINPFGFTAGAGVGFRFR